MRVRQVRKNEEEWLMDELEERGYDPFGASFRSREFYIFEDEGESNRLAFVRLRENRLEGDLFYELSTLGVLEKGTLQDALYLVLKTVREAEENHDMEFLYSFPQGGSEMERVLNKAGFRTVDASQIPGDLYPRVEEREESFGDIELYRIQPEEANYGHVEEIEEEYEETEKPEGENMSEEEIDEFAEELGINRSGNHKYST